MAPVATTVEEDQMPAAPSKTASSSSAGSTTTTPLVPTLDWADLRNPAKRDAFLQLIHSAAKFTGFLYLKNYDIPAEEIERQFEIARELFALPAEEKRKPEYALGMDYQGHKGIEDMDNPVQPHLNGDRTYYPMEFWNISGKSGAGNPNPARAFPEVINANRAEIDAFTRKLHGLALEILEALAIVLQIPESEGGKEFLKKRHNPDAVSRDAWRYLKYPAIPEGFKPGPDGIVRTGAHADFGSLTLLIQKDHGGLQVLHPETNEWFDVPPKKDHIIVNLGDAISFWSNSYLASTMHRVVADTPDQQNVDRYSMAYFARPDADAVLTPIPSPFVDQTMKGEALTATQWLDHRLKGTYGVKK